MKTFQQFLEERKGAAHLTALDKELGVSPENATKDPKVGSFFGFGDTYNLSPYKVLGYTYGRDGKTPITAKIQLMNLKGVQRRKFVGSGDKTIEVDDAPDNKIYYVRVDSSGKPDEKDLEDLLTQGMSPAGGAPAGGGMGGPGGPNVGMIPGMPAG